MILKIILQSFLGVFSMILTPLIERANPQELQTLTANLSTYISAIINISQQSINFLHFIVGDTVAIILPVVRYSFGF